MELPSGSVSILNCAVTWLLGSIMRVCLRARGCLCVYSEWDAHKAHGLVFVPGLCGVCAPASEALCRRSGRTRGAVGDTSTRKCSQEVVCSRVWVTAVRRWQPTPGRRPHRAEPRLKMAGNGTFKCVFSSVASRCVGSGGATLRPAGLGTVAAAAPTLHHLFAVPWRSVRFKSSERAGHKLC